MQKIKIVIMYLLASMFIFGGINHFVNPQFYLPMMPTYIPYHQFMIDLSGVLELVFGVALLIPACSHLAAWGLVALLVAVFPANINMALNPGLFPDVPQIALWIRLPVQALFVWLALIYTKKAATGTAAA